MRTTTLSAPTRRTASGWDVAQMVLNLAAVIAMAVMMWAAFLYAQPATNLAGDEQTAQRIFYLHMGCNFAALSAFLLSLIGSIGYLVTRNLEWDRLSHASIELGTLFGIGMTLSGSIWAKPTWNTYWTWDPRLTTVTITLLIYVAYLLFRSGIENRHTRARFASIYALFAFLSVPMTYYSARWFRSIHPVVFNGDNQEASGSFAIGPTMGQTVMIAAISFCILFAALLILRWQQLRLQDRIEAIREELE
jgi:heme exporter protein C